MHDNIGAQLLSALHTVDGRQKDDLLRDTLGDLRGIINAGFNARFDLAEIVADLRTELADWLELHGLALDWPQEGAAPAKGPANGLAKNLAKNLAGVPLDFRQANSLRAILREVASNTIKHAGATRLEVSLSCDGALLHLIMRDNGCGFAAHGGDDGAGVGNGLANMAERARLLNGAARIRGKGIVGGNEVAVTLPLTLPHAPRMGAA